MRTLLQFLAKYSILLLFLFLEAVAFVLIVRHNNFQQSAVFSSTNALVASVYQAQNAVLSYLNLRTQNEELAQENIILRNYITKLENDLEKQQEGNRYSLYFYSDKNLSYRSAKVIHSSTRLQRNYLTLNKGARDGVHKDMGVINSDGVVGIVSAVSGRYALVIPVLNPLLNISCKLQKNDYVATLNWNGVDYRYAQLNDVARHIEVAVGDTVLTSGYSNVFPENIPVGVVSQAILTENDAYYNIQVELFVDFGNLNYVSVIEDRNRNERLLIQAD